MRLSLPPIKPKSLEALLHESYGDVLRFSEDYISRVALIHKRHLSTLSSLLLLSKYETFSHSHSLCETNKILYHFSGLSERAFVCRLVVGDIAKITNSQHHQYTG